MSSGATCQNTPPTDRVQSKTEEKKQAAQRLSLFFVLLTVLQTSVCFRAKRKLKFAVQPRYVKLSA